MVTTMVMLTGTTMAITMGCITIITSIATPVGTIVTITDLFANVPARKKFLKSTKTELDAILDVITSYCLSRVDVHFVCNHNGNTVIDSPPVKDIKEKEVPPTKYFLSTQYVQTLVNHKARHESKGNGFGYSKLLIPKSFLKPTIKIRSLFCGTPKSFALII